MNKEVQIQALASAIYANTNPNKFYSLPDGKVITLPTTQGTGTTTQRKTYADMKAREILA